MARPRSDIEPRILHAARERFLVDGVDGASLREIARDAKTNIGMIYYYFATKDDLFLAVIEEVYEGVLADMTTALAPDAPIETRIERLFSRFDRLTDDETIVFRIVMREALASSPRLGPIIERFRRGHLPLILTLVGEGIASKTLTDRVPPPLVFFALISLGIFPQIARRVLASRTDLPFSMLGSSELRLAPVLVDVLFNGVKAARGLSTEGEPR